MCDVFRMAHAEENRENRPDGLVQDAEQEALLIKIEKHAAKRSELLTCTIRLMNAVKRLSGIASADWQVTEAETVYKDDVRPLIEQLEALFAADREARGEGAEGQEMAGAGIGSALAGFAAPAPAEGPASGYAPDWAWPRSPLTGRKWRLPLPGRK